VVKRPLNLIGKKLLNGSRNETSKGNYQAL